ncbi:PTS transporter subunit EIIC [Lactiplantibacillus daowaiensis]|uniref:Permease IIC component n=1 Tax=Lactiplantibacillus daowaiensis TaxID=2559918 RepID=A0ABW1RW70_9LACO|nr:PTS transporter subunit EIIC [Lactiplantibacillus daowaiensis]
MSSINKMMNQLQRFDTAVAQQRYFRAIRDTLTLLFPFVLVGAFINVLNQAVFSKNGFFNHIYYLSHWIPGFKLWSQYTTMLSISVNDLIAVIAAFAVANFVVRSTNRDNLLAGLTSALCFVMLNFNFDFFSDQEDANGSQFLEGNLGSQGIFLAILVGLLTGWIFSKLAFKPHDHQLIESRTHLLQRAKNNMLPIILSLLIFSAIGFGISFVSPMGLNGIFYAAFKLPFNKISHIMITIFLATLLSNLFWLIGIIGPISFSGNGSVSTVQNLQYAIQHGSAWGAPNPITIHTVYDAFANVGGPGMTLALIIAILWQSRNQDFRLVAKTSWLPAIFNFNQPLLVGLPILYSPLLAVPFLLAPMASMVITWVALKLSWMPPVAYPIYRTMPGFLMGWLGTGGDWRALLVSVINLAVATAIYLPFILINNRIVTGGADHEA